MTLELLPPINPLCCYVGRGCALVEWEAPTVTVDPWYYELYYSRNNVLFELYMTNIFNTRVFINGLPPETTIYMGARAVYTEGTDEQYSPFAVVKKGKIVTSPITMRITAVNGSRINAGSVFNFFDIKTGRLISLRTSEDINIVN
jgi:hypothetical protein